MKVMPEIDHKRKSERVSCVVPVEGKDGSLFEIAQTIDVSHGGIGFISRHQIPLNKEVMVALDLEPGEDPVFVLAKVRWVVPIPASSNFRIGMSFENVLRGSKSRLDSYFHKR